jgi:hypothetical protein
MIKGSCEWIVRVERSSPKEPKDEKDPKETQSGVNSQWVRRSSLKGDKSLLVTLRRQGRGEWASVSFAFCSSFFTVYLAFGTFSQMATSMMSGAERATLSVFDVTF